MIYNYYAKEDYYAYLSGGVQAWDLLLPNNVGLKKGDTVKVIETDNTGDETGRATSGTIVFNGVDGILTVNGNRDFYYINNLTTTNMYTLYRATLSQSGTNDPTAVVLENTTGYILDWSYSDIGYYYCNLSVVTDWSKVTMLIGSPASLGHNFTLSNAGGDYDININTGNSLGVNQDSLLVNCTVEIRFYS